MTPAALLAVCCLCVAILWAPRRYALLAIFAGILFLSQRGGIDIGGIRMHAGRFLELAAFIRVMFRRELPADRFGQLDKAVAATYVFVTVAFLLRTTLGYGTSAAVTMVTSMSKAGDMVDMLLIYVVFRGLLHNLDDVRWLLQRVVILLVPLVACLLIERVTFQNPLQILGSMSSIWIDDEDGGRIRCFGAFSHPSLLGTLGAWLAVLYVALILSKGSRLAGAVGFGLSVAIVGFANSGGPVTSLVIGMVGWGCWFIREKMRWVRIGIACALVALAVLMRDPIWYLPSKMSILFGGGGWHRSYLMNQAISNVGQWWLAGMPLDLTTQWFGYSVMGSADITNLYVSFGIDGGLGALALFIWLIVVAFMHISRNMARLQEAGEQVNLDRILVWGLGCGVLVHVANYFSITYFDQTNMLWLFQLAAAAIVVRQPVGHEKPHDMRSKGRRVIGVGGLPARRRKRIRLSR